MKMTFSDWLKHSLHLDKPCPPDPGIDALLAVVRIVARLMKSAAAISSTHATSVALMSLASLLPDLLKIMEEYDDIPCEVQMLNEENYARMLAELATEFGFSAELGRAAVNVSLKLVGQLKAITVPSHIW